MNNVLKVIALIVVVTALVAASKPVSKPEVTLVLNKDNTASLALPITEATATILQQELLALDKVKTNEPIYLTLNSPGGSIPDGMRVVQTAQGLRRQVHTITIFSASMSFVISQLLETRYGLQTGVFMAHPATVQGVSGTVPGTFRSEADNIISALNQLSELIAVRSGRGLQEYNQMVANELWMRGQGAIDLGFADQIVNVRCDESLQGEASPKIINLGPFTVNVVFDKCPLITDPLRASLDGEIVTNRQLKSSLLTIGGSRIETK